MTKRIGQLIHSKRRAMERFKIHLNMKDIEQIVWMIQNQLGMHIKRCSTRRSTWIIEYAKKMFYVAYDKNTKTIATVMPVAYAISDILKDMISKLELMNIRKGMRSRYFLDDLAKTEDKLDLAYTLFKEALK